MTGKFPDPVEISLPKGETPAFALAREGIDGDTAFAAIVKDAGDDPDVTHGALIRVDVALKPDGNGIEFRSGDGVGTVTRDGLPLAVGEPAINPAPRKMIETAIAETAEDHGGDGNVTVTVSVDGGAALAEKPGTPGSAFSAGFILGTTGVVVPYSVRLG